MRCPNCQSESVASDIRSVPLERPEGAWRHYHAQCMTCGERLWWNAHPGDEQPIVKSGAHECAFFKPAE